MTANPEARARVIQLPVSESSNFNPRPEIISQNHIATNINILRQISQWNIPVWRLFLSELGNTGNDRSDIIGRYHQIRDFARSCVALYDQFGPRLTGYLQETTTFEAETQTDSLFIRPQSVENILPGYQNPTLSEYLHGSETGTVFFTESGTHALGHATAAIDADRIRALDRQKYGETERRVSRIVHIVLDHHPDVYGNSNRVATKANVYKRAVARGDIDEVIFIGVNKSTYTSQMSGFRRWFRNKFHAIPVEAQGTQENFHTLLAAQIERIKAAAVKQQGDTYVVFDWDVDVLDSTRTAYTGFEYNPLMPLLYLGYITPTVLSDAVNQRNITYAIRQTHQILSAVFLRDSNNSSFEVSNIVHPGEDFDQVGISTPAGMSLSSVIYAVETMMEGLSHSEKVHVGIPYENGVRIGDLVEATGIDLRGNVYRSVCTGLTRIFDAYQRFFHQTT